MAGRIPPPKPQDLLGLTSRGNSSQRSGVEAKQQITGKSDLPKTYRANRSLDLDTQIDKTINSSASTPILAHPNTLPSNHIMSEGIPLLDLAPPTSFHSLAFSASTPPSPSRQTLDPLGPAQSAPEPSPSLALRLNSVTFGPGIAEALPYATTAQAPCLPPAVTPTDELAATTKANSRYFLSAPSVL